jgi:hypothetical protein
VITPTDIVRWVRDMTATTIHRNAGANSAKKEKKVSVVSKVERFAHDHAERYAEAHPDEPDGKAAAFTVQEVVEGTKQEIVNVRNALSVLKGKGILKNAGRGAYTYVPVKDWPHGTVEPTEEDEDEAVIPSPTESSVALLEEALQRANEECQVMEQQLLAKGEWIVQLRELLEKAAKGK